MKAKFLKRFRNRFTIRFTESAFFPVTLIDHGVKKTDVYSSITYAVAYAALRLLGANAFFGHYDKIERRHERLKYYKSLKP
jgi:hypothetical protein